MLVLTRKVQQSVVVGGPDTAQPMVTVTVLEVEGGNVGLGFEADASVAIYRWEVWQRILALDRQAGPPPALAPRKQADDSTPTRNLTQEKAGVPCSILPRVAGKPHRPRRRCRPPSNSRRKSWSPTPVAG
jgi:carbon storage regulator CsrA